MKEAGCCSFFNFDLSIGDGKVSMTVSTSAPHADVLAALQGPSHSTSRGARMSTGLRAGQVAHAVGVNIETLRYYERRGIIPKPDRSLGGHRLYDEDTVTILRVIKAAQRLGFSLDEVAELLEAGRHHHGPPAGLQSRAEAKLSGDQREDRRPRGDPRQPHPGTRRRVRRPRPMR